LTKVSLQAIMYECMERCSEKDWYLGKPRYTKFYPVCFQDCVEELGRTHGVRGG